MRFTKHIIATVAFTGLFTFSVANAQTSATEPASGLQQIVSSIVLNALKTTSKEIEAQLENVKENASEIFLEPENNHEENLTQESEIETTQLASLKNLKDNKKEANQTNSNND